MMALRLDGVGGTIGRGMSRVSVKYLRAWFRDRSGGRTENVDDGV